MTYLRSFFRMGVVVTAIALSTVSLGSCTLAKNQLDFDRAAEKDLQDYRDVLAPRSLPDSALSAPAPEFQSVIATPPDLKLPSPLVTVSVNQTVSLRELMFELADQADVDLEMDPQIRGSIIFTAKEKPFNVVVARICDMAGLRYKFENNVLRLELDRPYIKNYKIDYMNVARKSSSGVTTDISSASSSDTTSASAGSTSSVDNTFEGDFWKDVDEGLKQILTASDTYMSLATMADPISTPVAPPPPPPQLDANGQPLPATVPPPASMEPPSLNVSMGTSSEPLVPSAPATYSISRQSGIVSVFASERQHKLVQKYFDDLRRVSTTQVLIEAKVLEVTLTDEFSAGIDWTAFQNMNLTGLGVVTGATFAAPAFTPASDDVFSLTLKPGNDVQPVISALSRFGTVRALSSPRVTVLNNQPAIVNVAENEVFFRVESTVTPASAVGVPPTITFNTTRESAPQGVLLNVIPTANNDTGEIILALRPTVSKRIGEVEDPSIALTFGAAGLAVPAGAESIIPVLAVQEMDSIIKLQSGQTLVMGGLMKDANNVTNTGIPVLQDLPMVGAAFRGHGDSVQKSELVIFLKATIIPGSNVDETDREMYQKFGRDRHPTQL